jgi:PAS domain S-box-containing protein
VVFVLLVCLAGILLLANDVLQQIDRGATANADAMQWTLSRTNVELLALDVAVHEAIKPMDGVPSADDLAELRTRFDVFYSRVTTLGAAPSLQALRSEREFATDFALVSEFLDAAAPIIDGPDPQLRRDLPILYDMVARLRPISREMSLAGLQTFAATSQRIRLQVERTLLMAAALTVVLILTLLILVFVLLRLDRINRARSAEVELGAARLAAIVGTAQDAIITLEPSGRIVDCNAAAEALFGHMRAQLLGNDLGLLLFPPDQQPVLQAALDRALGRHHQGLPHPDLNRARLKARSRRGDLFPVELTASSTSETPRLIVAFFRDLTEQVVAEAALVHVRDEALAGERAKAEVLAVMSHEVRTPLNGLLGTLDLLGQTRLDARQKDYLRILETSGQLLLHHVNDVLDIARLDSGLMPRAEVPVDLHDLAQEVIENQRAAAEARGNRLELELPQDGQTGLISDQRLLKRVLLNLLGNAVKFTEGGRIRLSVRHLGPHGPTEFRVSDTGIGISEQDLSRIFEDFVTLDASYARSQGGTGLGLGIARRIVAQLGGTLMVDSTPGLGSSFHFALTAPILPGRSEEAPAAPAAPAVSAPAVSAPAVSAPAAPQGPTAPGTAGLANTVVAAAPAEAPLGSLDVLVAEDNEINRLVLRDMLARFGHKVTEASDGADCLRAAALRRFDVILMDISMPNMDGLQATEALRAGDGPNRRTPVIALTAHALPEERSRFRTVGLVDVVTKPFGTGTLNAALRRALAPGPGKAGKAAGAGRGTRAKARPPPELRHLVPAFLADADQAMARIARLAANPEGSAELPRTVHRIAGSAGLIGAHALARALARIETALKTGDTATSRMEFAKLPALWAETRKELLAAAQPLLASPSGTA